MIPTVVRWPLLTSVGLAAGVAAALVLQRPIEALVGMILVTPVVTLLVGLAMGASQWLEVRRSHRHATRWLLVTAVGLGGGLTLGVVAAEVAGQMLLGRPLRLLSLAPFAQAVSMLFVGALAGGTLGLAQRLSMRDLPARWPLVSAVGLGAGLSIGSALATTLLGALTSPAGVAVLAIVAGAVLGLFTYRVVNAARDIAPTDSPMRPGR